MKCLRIASILWLLIASGTVLRAQQVEVSGQVTAADDGRPLPGVSVHVQGGGASTFTNERGRYSVTVGRNSALIFSSVGFIPKEESVNGRTTIHVALQGMEGTLDEVVVVGYGTQRRKDLTGAVSSVKADELALSSAPDVGHMLQGKAAGVMIQQNSAQPGGGLDILIRGAGSVLASNAPLIVVDGFPISDLQIPNDRDREEPRYDAGTFSLLNSFNPNDIESIDILKDASATSIYGARAANGVILITTKRGKEGKPVIQYSNNFSFQRFSNSFDVLPLNEWMQVRNEAAYEQFLFENGVYPWGYKTLEEAEANPIGTLYRPRYTQKAIDNVGRGTDWISLMTRNGRTQQHNISASGGTQSTRYLVSGNYYGQDGIVSNSGLRRYSFRTNFDQELSKYVKLGMSLTASRVNSDNSQLGGEAWEKSGIIRAAIQQGPHILAIDDDGNYPLNPELGTQPNAYSLLTITDQGVVDRVLVNSFLDIMPIDDLTIRLKGGMDRGNTWRGNYMPRTTLYGALQNGKAYVGSTNHNDYLMEATANYRKNIADVHKFDFLVGISEQQTKTSANHQGNSGFITDAFLWNNLESGAGIKEVRSSRGESVIASYFGRVNYNFNDRFLATFSVRTDGASVFARNHKWATFPALSVGWNLEEEKFFEPLKDKVSQLKIRVGYGKTGNASIGGAAYAASYAYPAYVTGDDGIATGVSQSRLENPDLKWETTTEYNIGLDFGLFKGKLNGVIEVYDKVISDLLAIKPLNSYHEINTIMANIGSTHSRGFEVTLNYQTMQTDKFSWKTTATIGRFKDTWKERAPDWKPNVYENYNDPLRVWYSRAADGIMQIDEDVSHQPGLMPGQIKIKDLNGYQRDGGGNPVVDENGRFIRTGAPDGRIDEADMISLGTTDPSAIVGLSNRFTYKNFSLMVDFHGMFGRKMEDPNFTEYGITADGIHKGYNALRTVKDRWTPTNPSTTHPSSFYGWSQYTSGDFFVQDAWFVRLQNVSLGYTLPQNWTRKFSKAINLHVDAHNLFVITPYSGVDPETDVYTAAYPYVRTYTIGANISF